jgi:catecholate siderophore receptor
MSYLAPTHEQDTAPNQALRERSSLLPLGALMLAGVAPWSAPAALAQAAQAEKVKELATINVQAELDKPDGARATVTRVGKVLQDPHDVPQAITTVTRTIMEQQQVSSLKEALRNVSGLSFNAAEGGRSGDNMNLRGFYTFGDMYLDGIRDTAQYNRETFNLDQVDVLRGAGAMLFGRGQAGGVINQVSKMPLRFDQYKLTGSIGTDGYHEVTADLNKAINSTTALRINLMKRDEGNWRHNPATGSEADLHRDGVALSLGLNLRTDNQFWLNHYQASTNDNPDYGVPFDNSTRRPSTAFPASTFWGTEGTFDKSRTSITTLINEYRISPQSQLRTQLRVADYERSYWARTPSATQAPNSQALVLGNGGVANGGPTRISDYETITLQSDFNTKFQFAGMKHEVLTGLEYLNENSYRHTLQNVGGLDASNPPSYLPGQASLTGQPNVFHSDSYAAYVQDTVEFIPQWKATLGVRHDEMDATYSSATSPKLKFGENSWRSAISYHPTDETHYYLGWSDSFSPTADLYQLTVKPQPAERSDVIELGAKWLLLDGDLALRAAIYQATKNWERNADLESTAAILTKKRRTTGLELEAAGRINERWEIFAGLALMDAKILEVAENINATTGAITLANPAYAGQRARNTPKYTINLWSTYQIGSRWKVGGGLEAKGDRQALNPSSAAATPTLDGVYHPNTAPSYVRWDAMVAYEQSQWTMRLNIKNVLDKVYYDSVYDNGGFTVPGPRRTAILTAEYKF